jgi:hypothetical protein
MGSTSNVTLNKHLATNARRWRLNATASLLVVMLSGCGGGGSGSAPVVSTPTPPVTPASVPTPAPSPVLTPSSANYDTAEYRRSSGVVYHGAITAYQAGASGAGVTVGIVDTGIAETNAEFAGRISPLSRDFGGNGSITDVSGHGTAVAETLAGARNDNQVLGMAWGATVLALRADTAGSCASSAGCSISTNVMGQAVDYARQSGARVINLSLGGDTATPDLLNAVSRATSAGIIIVVAAGNVKAGETPSTMPGALAASIADPRYGHGLVIIASSVNADGTVSDFSAGVAGHEQRSLAALGNMVETMNQNGQGYYYSGTSFSAPQIAGAAALLAQAFPNLTSAQIVELLMTSARDAGASGPDAQYGMGILDVAKAFQPKGTLSLAGTTASVNPNDVNALSTAMGDAAVASLSAVALDSYQRPYEVSVASGFTNRAPQSYLAATLLRETQQVTASAGGLHMAFSIASNRRGTVSMDRLDLARRDVQQARFLSGTIIGRINPKATMALGLSTGTQWLEQSLNGQASPAFLVATGGAGDVGPDFRAGSSMALRHQIGQGLALTGGMEMGEIANDPTRLGTDVDAIGRRMARYQAASLSLNWTRGALGLTTGMRMVNEQGSALGARFSSSFGAQSARSLFASMGAQLTPAEGLTIRGSVQRGWTYAAAGGALLNGGTLATQSWSAEVAQQSLFAQGDMMGLRFSAPLRVMRSRFNLTLPDSWDWESGTATTRVSSVNLAPRGAERDMEFSYGLGVSGGWLGANLYMRTQPGNLAAAPDDYGMAVRWSVGW